MKKLRHKRKKVYTNFFLDQIKHKIKLFLLKYKGLCFYILTGTLLVFLFFLFYIMPDMITRSQYEDVFLSTNPSIAVNEKENNNTKNIFNDQKLITINNMENKNLINTKNVEYKSDEYYDIENHFDIQNVNTTALSDLNYLKNNLYIVDPKTDITPDVFDISKLINTDLHLKDNDGPKVLIFNTHSSEVYKYSSGKEEGGGE